MVTNPVTCSPDNTLAEVDALSPATDLRCPVVDADGVLWHRDQPRHRFETDQHRCSATS